MMEKICFGIQIQLCRTSLAEPSEGRSVAKRVIPKKIGATELVSQASSEITTGAAIPRSIPRPHHFRAPRFMARDPTDNQYP